MGHDSEFSNRVNKGKTYGDDDYEYGSIHMPWLTLTITDGYAKISGHEGRHRAAALIAEGVASLPVAIRINGNRYNNEAPKIPLVVEGEFNNQIFGTQTWHIIDRF